MTVKARLILTILVAALTALVASAQPVTLFSDESTVPVLLLTGWLARSRHASGMGCRGGAPPAEQPRGDP